MKIHPSPANRFAALLALTPGISIAALSDNFDTGTYPDSGTGWSSGWVQSYNQGAATNGNAAVTGTVTNANPLNGGGNYLSVTTTVANVETGIRRDIGAIAASPYTLTFDWRYDSDIANFNNYNDRIHFGASNTAIFGTNNSFSWLIGVVGGDNPGTDGTLGTSDDVAYSDGLWYFYDNTSTSANGGFTASSMRVSTMALTSGLTYSFIVTVDPATQKYSASITDGTNTFAQTNMDFRNQVDTTGFTSLLFGGANTGTGHTLNWSIDNINIVPEPSTALLAGLSGMLCFVRRRITG